MPAMQHITNQQTTEAGRIVGTGAGANGFARELIVGAGLEIDGSTLQGTVTAGVGGSTGIVDNAIVRADGIGGTTLQGVASNGPTITDTGVLTLNNDLNMSASGTLMMNAAQQIYLVGRLRIKSPVDGVARFSDANDTSLLRIVLGTNDASGVSLAKSGVILQSRLGDSSDLCAFEALTLRPKSFTVATLPTPGTAGRVAYASDAADVGNGVGMTVFDNSANWKRHDTGATVTA